MLLSIEELMRTDQSCFMPYVQLATDSVMVVYQNIIISVSSVKTLCSAPEYLMRYHDGLLHSISGQVRIA